MNETPSRGKVFKFSLIAISAVLIVFALIVLWSAFLSPEAKRQRESDRNYELATKSLNEFEDKMRADTYGGKTPEETLSMFIEALENDDIELAMKYVYWSGGNSNIQMRENVFAGINKAREENIMDNMLALLKTATPAGSSMPGVFGFELHDPKGEFAGIIGLTFNDFSGVWKISSI